MTTKKQTAGKQIPVHTLRFGEVTVSIFLRQSNAGYSYWDFVLGRCWNSMATGKEAHGSSFFDRNEQDLILAVREASAWIRGKLQSSIDNQPPAANDTTSE